MELFNVVFKNIRVGELNCGYVIGEIKSISQISFQDLKIFNLMCELSITGDIDAIFQLASCYEFSACFYDANIESKYTVILKEINTAIELYKYAANNGSIDALHHLGEMYEHGIGFERNRVKAKEYFRQAANLDSVKSLFYLGVILNSEEQSTQAYDCFFKAADLDHFDSMYLVSEALFLGNIVWEKNIPMALYYLKKLLNFNPNDQEAKNLLEKINAEI